MRATYDLDMTSKTPVRVAVTGAAGRDRGVTGHDDMIRRIHRDQTA